MVRPPRARLPSHWSLSELVFGAFLGHGLVLRLVALPRILAKWTTGGPLRSWGISALGLGLGVVEDACVCSCMCFSLWAWERLIRHRPHFAVLRRRCQSRMGAAEPRGPGIQRRQGQIGADTPSAFLISIVAGLCGLLYTSHFLAFNGLFLIDLVFVRTRQMRFTWAFVGLYLRERRSGAIQELAIAEAEWRLAAMMAAVTVVTALVLGVAVTRCHARWLHSASEWDRQLWRARARARHACGTRGKCSHRLLFSPAAGTLERVPSGDDDDNAKDKWEGPERSVVVRGGHFIGCIGLLVAWTVLVAQWMPSVAALIAWNASLNEPLGLFLGVQCKRTHTIRQSRRLSELIDTSTENCTFLDPEALARRTWGFTGPRRFDVRVDDASTAKKKIKPNVLVVVIESFRKRDSRYLLGEDAERFLPGNITLTPNFDAWARRGVAFSNMWSTWRTSRSIEQILFGQPPYDSPTDSGTSTGRTTTALSGLPQLLHAHGYETLFTTGTRTDYDGWDAFLSSHGFDMVLDGWQLAELASSELGLDWTAGDHMMSYWGIHDDVTFPALSHLLRATSKAKATKKPWFATHYTISSHVPFDEQPDWYFRFRESKDFPDFGPLYETIKDPVRRELVQNYAAMRYFADMAFGTFMAELEASGVLKETIVIVTADHGQSPEYGAEIPEEDQVSAMNIAGALIAEGRLGANAGLIIDDATAQYDWLNTIADIVGVPEMGFLQTGIGRSLLRLAPGPPHRIVYSHNPAMNLALVQGHVRVEFFADVDDIVRVFHIRRDPSRQRDLLSELPRARVQELLTHCEHARLLHAYFRQRWDRRCLLLPQCR